MEETIQYILYFHAFSGGIALLSGLLAIATKKGSKKHILSGEIYFWAMFSVIVTGLIVGFYRNNIFLQTIAVFSFYLAFTGKRVLRFKKAIVPQKIDWILLILAISVGGFMLYLGITNFLRVGFVGAIPMLLVFGGLLFWMGIEDGIGLWKKKFVKNEWLFKHIGRMGGSFIATSTAFLLTNIKFDPAWVVWLAPTFIGTPLITYSIRKWKKKMRPKLANQ